MMERSILNSTYFDIATIKRNVKSKNEFGATSLIEETIYSNIKCGISKNSLNLSTMEDTGIVNNTYTLFADPSYKIQAGDIIVSDFGEFTSSKPHYYPSHLQSVLVEVERV